jgi:flavin-binding protein dodecin
MSNHIYKKLELVGSSKESIEAAAQNAVKKASETIRNMRWMEVGEIRGHIVDGSIDHWQVGVKIGFTLEDQNSPETLEEKKS